MKIGSLCTGYGGLDMAVETYFDAETIWCAEIDKYASKLIAERFDYPNHGDIKKINWAGIEPIDILTAGYPCQPFSNAGQRKGIEDERHIWPHIKEAIGILRPRFIVLENVRGHLTLGFKEVLADLAEIGYDARWQIVRASDVGAPHRRERLFIVAYAFGARREGIIGTANGSWQSGQTLADSNSCTCEKSRRADSSVYGSSSEEFDWSDREKHRSGCETHFDTCGQFQPHNRKVQELGKRFTPRCEMHLQAVPDPLDQDKLNPKFVEYMMGLPKGWVTDLDISRAQQLKMLGNGVVPQQAYFALEQLFAFVDAS
jgi:DNA (cytosine-5)-methyltransferase 1